uniref:CG11379-PA n=1 Tax=Drosophila phaeopleura TaxID=195712 RepID=D1GZ16_9MUSC|nr:CG11379-PA [Drosophila phaeopleura]
MARLTALGLAVLFHSVMGISYYHYFRRTPAGVPLIGAWLFSACVVALLQAIHIFPATTPATQMRGRNRGGGGPLNPPESSWGALFLETGICCLVLDVTLTKLWRRVESLCQCAIVGVLQTLGVEDQTFLACEYWTLGLTTGLIGACLLWLTLWATALPRKVHCGLLDLRRNLYRRSTAFIFGPPLKQTTRSSNSYLQSTQSFTA